MRVDNILHLGVKELWGLARDPMRDAWVRNALAFTKAHRGTVNRVVGALLALITTRSGGGIAMPGR